jgi:hypothetical protein
MSLLSYSSPWTNDDLDRSNNLSRKRTPTLGGIPRKTVKVRPNHDFSVDQYQAYTRNESSETDKETRGNKMPETIDDHIETQMDKTAKINSILNKITGFSSDDKLGDFNPMPYPTHIAKKNSDSILPGDEPVDNGINPLMPKLGKPEFDVNSAKPIYYKASEPRHSSGQYASYRDAYGKEGLTANTKEPYYSKMGIGGSGDKVMDRLNYMTQMLESLQMEKTNHVTEEFVLYSLLGVFMIYIVDGFSRGGKYVR